MSYKDPEVEKQKHKEWSHQHYLNNKEKYKESHKKAIVTFKRNRAQWSQELRTKLSCKTCGESRFPCLEFHHRDPKEKDFNVGWAIYHYAKERIIAEIAKCDVLCRNCHAWEHWIFKEQTNGGMPESGNGPVC